MRASKLPVTFMLCLTLTTSALIPVAPVQAASLSDILPQVSSSSSSNSSGGGLIDILLGLLLGKFVGNWTSTGQAPASLPNSSATGAQTGAGSSATANAIIATAQQYMGVPYVWGGETPSGFDCSGFTQYVMKQNGITLPRTAAEQYATGTAVDKANLKVGDLVFFTTYKPGASHEGIYMGSGKFIHASSAAKQVTISSLDETYYTEHYIGARRYF